MAILYIAAESFELEPFAGLLTGLRRLKWPISYAFEGILEGRRLMLAANGAGPRLSAQAVEVAIRAVTAAELSSSKLEAVVSTGFCGALSSALRESEIIVGTEVLDMASGEKFECAPVSDGGAFVGGRIVSQDSIVCKAADKQQLGLSHDSVAVDMEAGGVAARAKRASLPFYCIKVVSDRVDETFGFDLNRMRSTDGRIARGKIMAYAFSHPHIVPELFRLRRRTAEAAKALGDFLVSCRIKPESSTVFIE
jgi:adenosylhomocysteine nucleosidase